MNEEFLKQKTIIELIEYIQKLEYMNKNLEQQILKLIERENIYESQKQALSALVDAINKGLS